MRTLFTTLIAVVLTSSFATAQAPKAPDPVVKTEIKKPREVKADTVVTPGTVLKAGTKLVEKQYLPIEDFDGIVPVPLPSRELAVCHILTEDVTTTVPFKLLAGTRPAVGSSLRSEKTGVPLSVILPPVINLPSGTKLKGSETELKPEQALKEVQILDAKAKAAKAEADAAALEAAQAKNQANSAKTEAAQAKADAKAAQAKALALEAKLVALEAKAGDDVKALREEMAETLRQAKAHAATKAAQAEDAAKDFAAQQAADALVKAKEHTDKKVGEVNQANKDLAAKLKAAQQDIAKVLPPEEYSWRQYYGQETIFRGWVYAYVRTTRDTGGCWYEYKRVRPQ